MTDSVSKSRYEREKLARKEAERLLDEKSRALFLSNEELSTALAKLQETQAQLIQNEKMASIGQMAAGVAHEINNPIGFVASNLDSLRHYLEEIRAILDTDAMLIEASKAISDLTDRVVESQKARDQADLEYVLEDLGNLITESIDGTNRVRKIVADLKDYSHVDKPDMVIADLHDIIEKAVNVAGNEIKYVADVVFEFGDIPELECYGGKIGQVVLNIIVNAAQAMKDRGTITVRTGCTSGCVWFEVEDQGEGISPEVLSKIYDPFFTTKDVGKGTGLGLHLVHKIVTAHGGSIDIDTAVGVGTTFRVSLPQSQPESSSDLGDTDLAA